MSLPVKTFAEIVAQQQSQMQASSVITLDFDVGSIMGAFTNAGGGNFLALQALATAILADTRLTTSQGQAVDSFCEQFSFPRYQGNPSDGNVTFSRNVTTILASIPVGSIVSVSSTNNLNFQVIQETDNPNYNPVTNSYDIQISTSSIDVPVQCQTNGVFGNVLAGQINTIDSPLVGVDFVTNDSDFTNGVSPWSDDKYKLEFALYIGSLTRATGPSIKYAVSTTPGPPQIYRNNVVENKDFDTDAQHLGYFYVVVDDGTGVPNTTLIENVSARLESYRGLTIAYSVIGPDKVEVDVEMDITLVDNPTESEEIITAKIQTAISNYIDSLEFNSLLPYTRLAEIIYDADDNILNVTNILLNGGTSDITTDNTELLFADDITVNYT